MNNEPTETNQRIVPQKRDYTAPKLTTLGDVAQITLGVDLGEDLDAMFVTVMSNEPKGKKKKDQRFS